MKENSNKKSERDRLFLRDTGHILTLIVCVSMMAALLLFVSLSNGKSDIGAAEDSVAREALLGHPEAAGLPLIRIWTRDGRMPGFSIADKPDDELWGETITDNAYKNGYCTIENGSSMSPYASKMKIKVRGNTSVVYAEQDGKLPYKIVLNSPVRLFADGPAETRYILLANAGTTLKTWLGLRIGELCGIEWTPRSRYVNLVLNDEYQGLYLLTEARDGSALREHVGSGGFLIESDAYWWNEDVYFHSELMVEQVAFTVKFPELTDINDRRLRGNRSVYGKGWEKHTARRYGRHRLEYLLRVDHRAGFFGCYRCGRNKYVFLFI